LVVATGRPELDEVFPSIFAAAAPCEVRVGRLSPRAAESLVRALLPDADAPLVARLVERADGHALWLEELARAVVERAGDELPDTVLAMVQARAQALPPLERRALRAASVFGRRSWDAAVATLLGCDAELAGGLLSKLVGRDWLTADAGSRFAPARQFSFRQDVAREAAYAMLTEADRALGHRLAGGWLERAGEREAVVLARHFELGGEQEKAAAAYARGAHDALASNDLAGAIELAERAYAASAGRAHRGLVRAVQAEAHLLRGETALARERGEESVALAERGTRPFCRAVGALAVALGKLGDRAGLVRLAGELSDVPAELRTSVELAAAVSPTVVQLLVAGERDRARALASSLEAGLGEPGGDDPFFRGHVARSLGAVAAFTDDVAASIEHLRTAVASFEAAGDPRLACSLRKTLGWYLGEVGDLEASEATLRAALAGATQLRVDSLVPHAKHDLGSPLVRLGKLDEALALQRDAARAFEAQGDRRLASGAHAATAWILREKHDLEASLDAARVALELAPSDPVRLAALAQLAATLLAAARPHEALDACGEALAALERAGGVAEEGVTLVRLVRARALLELGARDAARDAAVDARRAVLERAARLAEPMRAPFLERITEHRETLALARELGGGEPS
jgi:tetratricopeptide (TPR) repeat protein